MLKIRIAIPFAGLALTACGQSEAGRPNVIYVFPDQYRNSSLGFWSDPEFAAEVGWKGDPVATPNLDRFAREATVLTEAVSNFPVSSPHRGMLLSGMYPERNGVVLNCMSERPESSLREDAECIGDVFSAAGYDCAYIGKLHADFPTKNNPQRPGTYVSDAVPEWDAYTTLERVLMFDDAADPYQLHNLAPEEHPALFAALCRELAVLLRDNDDVWFREGVLSDVVPYDTNN